VASGLLDEGDRRHAEAALLTAGHAAATRTVTDATEGALLARQDYKGFRVACRRRRIARLGSYRVRALRRTAAIAGVAR
jgi:hypothetical protein